MKNKKLLTFALVGIICVVLTAGMLSGCAVKITDSAQIAEEWAKAADYLANSAKETNYRAKSVYIFDNKVVTEDGGIITDPNTISQVEFLINFMGDDSATADVNETAILLQRAETSLAKTTYKKAYYGASLASGQKAKNAKFEDYKLYQYVTQSEITVRYPKDKKQTKFDTKSVTPVLRTILSGDTQAQILEFLNTQLPLLSPSNGDTRLPQEKREGIDGKSREDISGYVQTLIDSGVQPASVEKQGVVTTFYFELDEAHKDLALNGGKKKTQSGKYPVIVRFTQNRLDKITDDSDAPTIKLFMTYYPSNFSIQNYDATYTQYYDDNGVLQTILGDGESIVTE